ncbi:MAG: PAS domain S-box protein [Pyrinomonadaceae bacterium]
MTRELNEKTRAEEELRDSQARLAGIVDSAMDAIITVDSEQRILVFNRAAERMFLCPADEAIGQPLDCFIPKRFRVGHAAHIQNFGQTGVTTRAMAGARAVYGLRAGGAEFPLEASISQIEAGGQKLYTVIMRDITERERAEEALRVSEARFSIAFNASPISSVMATLDEGRYVAVNDTFLNLTGYKREEVIGRTSADLGIWPNPAARAEVIELLKSQGRIRNRETEYRMKDGQVRRFLMSAEIIELEGRPHLITASIDITERDRAEERFRQLIEGAPNGMVMVDGTGKLVLINAQIEKTFGYNRAELLGQPIEMLVPARFHAHHPAYRDSFITNPTARPMGAGRDLYGLRKDGSEFPVEIGLNPLQTEQGTMVLGTVVDITERKRAEETLRRSQAQLAGVIGSAMDAIISVDEEQRIVLFNQAAERMFLYPAEEAMGQPLDRFIPKRFRPTHRGHIEDFGRTHVTKRTMGSLGAIFGLRADGEEFPIEASISQLESEGRKFYTVILRDITERKHAEEALKEQARILDLAPVLIRDLSGRIIFWNSGSEQMYGWSSAEAVGKVTHVLLKTEFPRPLEEIKARLFAYGHWEGELIHIRRDGARIVVASHWVIHKNELDEPRAILEVNNDITERKQAEEEVRRLNEELEQRVAERTAQLEAANKELEAFSYSVSHDLRAPLRHINGFSQALLEDYADKLDADGRSYLQEVRSASQEMAQLIDDVLQLARVTRSEMRREVVNLSELAQSVVAELQKREPGHTVTVQIEDGLLAHGDKRLLRIMLVNLLGNAWKFTAKQAQPEIVFGHEQQDGETAFFVRDNGAGFDMTYADKLFGAFQRLHTVAEFEGTGIGLATVQRILNRHGGRVWAVGAVNQGATFYFTLPDFKGERT